MALSDIKISDLILHHTNVAIIEANYPTLRQYLLDRKPLPPVVNKVKESLSQHCAADKQLFMISATQEACVAQINSDAHEALHDEQEQHSDISLKTTYQSELHILESKLRQLESQCSMKRESYDRVQSLLSEYQIQLSQINSLLSSAQQDLSIIRARYTLNFASASGNIHVHTTPHGYPATRSIHVHGQTPQFPPYYGDFYTALSLQDQIAWARLYQKESNLLDEQRRLNTVINLKENEYQREQLELTRLTSEKTTTETRYSVLKGQLDIELPNRNQQRRTRQNERNTRETARTADKDPDLQQLSAKNRRTLKQRITKKNEELDKVQQQLLSTVEETSYATYLARLEALFSEKLGPQIGFKEREALNTILNLMKTYSQMVEQEQTIVRTLNGEKRMLEHMSNQLEQNRAQLQHCVTSNPQLAQANKNLEAANKQLAQDNESELTIRNNAFYSTLFGVGGSAIGAFYLLNAFVISPILIAVPAAFALLTLISLTVAIVYHFKQSASNEQIEQNTQTITDNHSTIEKQVDEARDLSQSIIPALTAEIEQKNVRVVQIAQQLETQRFAMSQHLGKAQNVMSNYGDKSFFGGGTQSPQVWPAAFAPTAPEEPMAGESTSVYPKLPEGTNMYPVLDEGLPPSYEAIYPDAATAFAPG